MFRRCPNRCSPASRFIVASDYGIRAVCCPGGLGLLCRTRGLYAPFTYSCGLYQRGASHSGSKGEWGERGGSSTSPSSSEKVKNTAGKAGASNASMKAAASVMNKSTELMEDREVAAAASKLLLLLAPTAKGKRQSSGGKQSTAAGFTPPVSSTSSYLAPPQPTGDSSLESLSTLSAPSDMLFGDEFSGLPSRRTHILSRWQQKEFDEAFEAAEAVLQEEERERQAQKKMKRKSGSGTAVEAPIGTILEEEQVSSAPVGTSALTLDETNGLQSHLSSPVTNVSLANPFKGLHEHLRRSYRLDEIVLAARETDLVLAKQEPKASVFSFLTLHSGIDTYRKHWDIKQALRVQHDSDSGTVRTDSSSKEEEEEYFEVDHNLKKKKRSRAKKGKSEVAVQPEVPIPESHGSGPLVTVRDAAMQWGGLGWDNPLVDVDYGLLLAQRLLLFPPAQRHFHALSGRVDVPCDFFADLDLPDCTVEEGERTLVEVLDYLEIRLPGVGFTDPFFLVLSNEEPEEMLTTTTTTTTTTFEGGQKSVTPCSGTSGSSSRGKVVKKKISYHIHARSMTHIHTREERSMLELRKVLKQQSRRRKGTKAKKSSAHKRGTKGDTSVALEDGETDQHEMDVSEDSSVEEAANIANELMNNKKVKGATKVIAFQDYRSVKLIADEINQTLGFNAIDEGCYRTHGSLRCAFSRKIPPSTSSTPVSAANAAAAAAAVLHQNKSGASKSVPLSGDGSSVSYDSNSLSKLVENGAPFAGLQPALVPLPLRQDQNEDLQKKLRDMHSVLAVLSAPEILEMTFCTRHLHDGGIPTLCELQDHLSSCTLNPSTAESIFKAATLHQFKLVKPSAIIGPQAAATAVPGAVGVDGLPLRPSGAEYDAYGNVVSPYLTEAAKWRRYKSVINKLQHAPPRAAMSFDIWVRIGLALHNFSNEEHVFEEWVKFSLKCPQKYSREACRKKWLQFERNPDALNWRRGFNYLNQTLWRQI